MQCRPLAANLVVLLTIPGMVVLLGIALLAQGAAALSPDGYVFYQSTGNNVIWGDNYTNSDFTANNETLQNVGGVPLWIEAQWSRHRNESLAVTYDSGNDINFVAMNMTTRATLHNTEFTAAAPATTSRTADIAYESVRGRGIIVWDNNTVDQSLRYSIWDGRGLSVNSTIAVPTGVTSSRFVRLVPDANSDHIMLIYNDGLNHYGTVLWNGSSWINATNITSNGVVATNRRPMDFGWYPDGNGILFFSNGTTNVAYREFNRTSGAWSPEIEALNIAATGQALDVCANPNNNWVGVIVTDSTGDANAFMWDGTAVETLPAAPGEDGAIETAGHNSKCEWERSGTQALFVFVDANARALHLEYFHYNLSADLQTRAWSINDLDSATLTPNIAGDDIESIKLRASPYNDSIMITFKDLVLDIRAARWDGDTIEAVTANYIIDANSATANAQSYEFIWNRFPSNPPSFTSGVNDSSNSTGPTNESSNVTFSAIATDPDGNQWYLIVCDSLGELGGTCFGNTYCTSPLANNNTVASCQYNTSSLLSENYTWFAYACDSNSVCRSYDEYNNLTNPFRVNHAPASVPYLSTLVPNVTTANITCIGNGTDNDTANNVSHTYVWWRQNESTGSFSIISGQSADHLNNTHYDSNDHIICQVTPTDNFGLAGSSINTSTAIVQNGTLSAQSALNSATVDVYANTSINLTCTVTAGDAENVTIILQDNRTGSFTESTTTVGDIYINQSNNTIGRLANQTSITYTYTIFAEAKGNYSFRSQCLASDTNVTVANSTAQTLVVIGYPITPINPANETRIDRDETNASMSNSALLQIATPPVVPDFTLITYRADLTDPPIAGEEDKFIGITTTSGGLATQFFNPDNTWYAGNYSWRAESTGGEPNGTRTFLNHGQLNTIYEDDALFPATTYYQNESATMRVNVSTTGPESRANISDLYSPSVVAFITSPNSTTDTPALSFTDPAWNLTYPFLSIGGVGLWTVNVTSDARFLFFNYTTTRTITVTGFMNITENTTSPATVGAYEYATTTCRVGDKHTQASVANANVTFYRDGSLLGSNLTNSTGHSQYAFQSTSAGTSTITCNVTNQPNIYYERGFSPEGNSTLMTTPFSITVENPPDSTIVDRDGADPSDPDTIILNVSVDGSVPDGVTITFLANLTDPVMGGQIDVLLGTNTTSSGYAILHYNPPGTIAAGNWTWYGNSSAGTPATVGTIIIKGSLNAAYESSSTNPDASYFQTATITASANITSAGSESASALNSTYGVLVTNTYQSTSGGTSSLGLVYNGSQWRNNTFSPITLGGVGVWNTSVNASGTYWYPGGANRTFTVYGYMNITLNTTVPPNVTTIDFATTICRVQDQDTAAAVVNANVTFYRNGTYIGSGLTNAEGNASLSFLTSTPGNYTVTCNVTDQPSTIYYYRGLAPEGNSSLEVSPATGAPPSFSGDVVDNSSVAGPTNESSNVTFSGTANDPNLNDWYLLICDALGTASGDCVGGEICRSLTVPTGDTITCQHNTTGELNEQYSWFAYSCNNESTCGAPNSANSPYDVNHAPNASPYLTPVSPTITDTITCNANTTDPDSGDTITPTYVWYRQNEGIGGYVIIAGQSASTLASSQFDSNDNIICQVTIQDNHGLSGGSANSTAVMVQQGTLSAASALTATTVYRTYSTTMNASCTVTDGEAASVTLIIQDNRTGSYTQSNTSTDAVYVSQSSFNLGQIVNTTVQQTVTVYTQTAGDYSFRAHCLASDTIVTVANSTPQTLTVAIDTTPPVISSVTANPSPTSAGVTWTTDDRSDSDVDYGTTPSLGSTVYNPSMVTGHSISLTSLSQQTFYYFNVTSCNPDNYCATAGLYNFTTTIGEVLPESSQGGVCTAVIIEQGPNYREGYISKGDVVEYYCELPHGMKKRETFDLTITNANEGLHKELTSPSVISGDAVVVYP